MLEKRTDNSDFVADWFKTVAGIEYIETENGNVITRINDDRKMMNVKGATALYNQIKSSLNTNVTLSNISDDEAKKLSKYILNSVAKSLALNKKEWELKGKDSSSRIMSGIRSMIYSQFKRCVDGFENKQISTVQEEIRQITTNNTNQGRSIFGFKKKEQVAQ